MSSCFIPTCKEASVSKVPVPGHGYESVCLAHFNERNSFIQLGWGFYLTQLYENELLKQKR